MRVKNGTRLILIDFNIYNPNIDRIVALRLMVEFWVGGGMHSNVDTVILDWTSLDDLIGYFLAAATLLGIFILRLMYEIDEMSWNNLSAIAKQIEFGDATASYGDTLSKKFNYTTLKSEGIALDNNAVRYYWVPLTCCKKRVVVPQEFENGAENPRHKLGAFFPTTLSPFS